MTELEAAWLAGILEGEGYFSLERDTKFLRNVTVVRVVLSMSDLDVVSRAAELMGAKAPIKKRAAAYKENYKDQYRAKVSGARAVAVMQRILPYMGARRRERILELVTAWKGRSSYSDGARRRVAKRRELANAGSISREAPVLI